MADISQQIISALKGFGVDAEVAEVQSGAAVDRYALKLAMGVKVRQVTALADDLAVAIAAPSVRILAPIPGTNHVGVEVPAEERKVITLEHVQETLERDHPLRFPVGVDVSGRGISARVDRLPHLIVAGATGSGKSVFVTAMLAHLVTHAEPSELRLILIDPKRVELAAFAGVRHLARPVATDVESAVESLESAVAEMDRRWKVLEEAGKKKISDLPDPPPYLLVVVDELADLMMTAGKRAEGSIVRLLQLGRAAGVHLILATQRPSTDVITGLIKTNAPSRMVFAVSSHTDSGVALGQSGAERLLGQGDGLWWPAGASQPERIQGVYLDDDDLEAALNPMSEEPEPSEAEVRAERLARLEEMRSENLKKVLAMPRMDEAPPPKPAPTAPEVPTAPTAPEVPTAPTAPEAPEPDLEPESHTPTARELAVMRQHARELEEGMEMAYAKGRRHGQLAMELPEHRTILPADWWAAILVGLAASLVGLVAFPLLIPAFGAWAGWTALRRRTSMKKYRGARP